MLAVGFDNYFIQNFFNRWVKQYDIVLHIFQTDFLFLKKIIQTFRKGDEVFDFLPISIAIFGAFLSDEIRSECTVECRYFIESLLIDKGLTQELKICRRT